MNNTIELHNVDCFEYMKGVPDGSVPLMVTDRIEKSNKNWNY